MCFEYLYLYLDILIEDFLERKDSFHLTNENMNISFQSPNIFKDEYTPKEI